MHFEDLLLIKPILRALHDEGYSSPTPIQEQAIPIILKGRDLLGCAQTGTGKTAAFTLPILQKLEQDPRFGQQRVIRCLIMTPTRELAIQIHESIQAYGRYTHHRSLVIFGGVGQQMQVDTLKSGTDILIATPGRLLDLIAQGYIDLKQLQYFVLDEADRMLDMGFIHDVRKVLKLLPVKRQSLFFSATMPPEIVELSRAILDKPEKVEVTPVSSTAESIQQSVYLVDKINKNALLVHFLQQNDQERVLVFSRTKYGADKMARFLKKHGITADAIHGDKAQQARQKALLQFKEGKIRVLVATDIAARGIDIDQLNLVINTDIPNVPETYVHRIGRTGRAGASGQAYSFCDPEEFAQLKAIERLIHRPIPVIEEHPFPWIQQPDTALKPVVPANPIRIQQTSKKRHFHPRNKGQKAHTKRPIDKPGT